MQILPSLQPKPGWLNIFDEFDSVFLRLLVEIELKLRDIDLVRENSEEKNDFRRRRSRVNFF